MQVPCVIVAHWQHLTTAKLTEWRDELVGRWGSSPHMHANVQRMVNGSLLGERIRQARPVKIFTGGHKYHQTMVRGDKHSLHMHHQMHADKDGAPQGALGIVNHTCNMSAGGILSEQGRRQGCNREVVR